jgi:predicted RNA binding protein YcfA (HicA-like mRNA interferase family)
MLTNSRDVVRRPEREGWTLVRVTGSHHVFKSPVSGTTVVIPHPKKDLGKGKTGWKAAISSVLFAFLRASDFAETAGRR